MSDMCSWRIHSNFSNSKGKRNLLHHLVFSWIGHIINLACAFVYNLIKLHALICSFSLHREPATPLQSISLEKVLL